MKVWTMKEPGGVEQLIIEDRPIPIPTDDEILIKVKGTAINRTDILTRENTKLEKPYPVLGVEVSGIIEKSSPNYPELKEGARVAGLVNRGGYAEYVTMPADRAILLTDSMSFIEGAAIPEVFLTAYQCMVWLGELKDNETILIHAAGSGVGTAAIQLARHIVNEATIIATAGKEHKLDVAKSLGADYTVNYHEENFYEKVLKYTDGLGADVILDFVGASYWEKNLKSAAIDGRWVMIGTLGGAEVDSLLISDLMQKRLSLKGTLLTPRSNKYKADLTKEFTENVLSYFTEGKIKPIVYSVHSFDNLKDAHREMEANMNTGKIVIEV